MDQPITVRYDFKTKYQIKGFTINCDNSVALFNLSRNVYFADFKDLISKAKEKQEKVKAGSNYFQTKQENEHLSLEANPINPKMMAALSNQLATSTTRK